MTKIPPAQRYQKGDRHYERAQQAWIILTGAVMSWQRMDPQQRPDLPLMTYGELAELMLDSGGVANQAVGRILGVVGSYCVRNDLPAINSIVVNRLTGEPGKGVVLRPDRTLEKEQQETSQLDWHSYRPPTRATLRKVWETM